MKVLDASAIFRSDLDFSHSSFVTTGAVLSEVGEDNARIALDAAIRSGNVRIREPSDSCIAKVKAAASESGDLPRLSETDVGLLALALEENIPIVSDDYNIQNVAAVLGIECEGVSQEGIKRVFRWLNFCPGCGKTYSSGKKTCDVCGSVLKRKPRRR